MATSNISPETKRNMAMNGWGLETFGFNSHEIPMYLHLDSLNDKKFGDLFLKIRVGDYRDFPKNLLNHEMQLMNRKIRTMGVMPWMPGADCLAREFKPYADVKNDRGETVAVWGEPQMGCKPCRDRDAADQSGLTAGTTETTLPSTGINTEPPEAGVTVVQPEAIKCNKCNYVTPQMRKTGTGEKPSTQKQQQNALRLHSKKHLAA